MREARRRGFDRAERQVVLGDGATWIWNLAEEHFPDATQIVDVFHANEHLHDIAKAVYGPGTDLAATWAQQRGDELHQGDFERLLGALRALANTHDDGVDPL